jgi:hypothetical protein
LVINYQSKFFGHLEFLYQKREPLNTQKARSTPGVKMKEIEDYFFQRVIFSKWGLTEHHLTKRYLTERSFDKKAIYSNAF